MLVWNDFELFKCYLNISKNDKIDIFNTMTNFKSNMCLQTTLVSYGSQWLGRGGGIKCPASNAGTSHISMPQVRINLEIVIGMGLLVMWNVNAFFCVYTRFQLPAQTLWPLKQSVVFCLPMCQKTNNGPDLLATFINSLL